MFFFDRLFVVGVVVDGGMQACLWYWLPNIHACIGTHCNTINLEAMVMIM